MKPEMLFPVISFSLVFAAILAQNTVCGDAELVLDTTGEPVLSGVQYYIIPEEGGTGGGVVPSSRTFNPEKFCPLDVVQTPFSVLSGEPVTLSPELLQEGNSVTIPLSSNVNIQFNSTIWLCPQSRVWKLDYEDPEFHQRFVTTGATTEEGYWFRIEKRGDAYILKGRVTRPVILHQFQPIGTFADPLGVHRLVLGGEPLKVQFKKVHKASRFEKNALRMFPFY